MPCSFWVFGNTGADKVLGVDEYAPLEEIKKAPMDPLQVWFHVGKVCGLASQEEKGNLVASGQAYKKLSLIYHPDKMAALSKEDGGWLCQSITVRRQGKRPASARSRKSEPASSSRSSQDLSVEGMRWAPQLTYWSCCLDSGRATGMPTSF